MQQIISVATFNNGIELKLNQQETNDIVHWIGNPQRKDFVEIQGGVIRQEPLLFLAYDKWLDSKGMYLCSKGAEHKHGRSCDCYVSLNSGNEKIPSLLEIAEAKLKVKGKPKELMLIGMRKTNPRLAEHIEKGGSFRTFPNGIKAMHVEVNPHIDRSRHHEWEKVQREHEAKKVV